MAGCSARPRGTGRRRGGRAGDAGQPGGQGDEEEEDVAARGSTGELEELAPASAALQPKVPSQPRPDVQVGDIIKVQTNLGWESVTVRARRANGKIDIQFKDGEYMRSVLPRILREPGGGAAAVAGAGGASAAGGQAEAEGEGSKAGGTQPASSSSSPMARSARGAAGPGAPPSSAGGGSSGGGAAGGAVSSVAGPLAAVAVAAAALRPYGFLPSSPASGDHMAQGGGGTTSSPRPCGPPGSAGDSAANEALATLDAQLSAQMRVPRRGRASAALHGAPADLGIAAGAGVIAAPPASLAVAAGGAVLAGPSGGGGFGGNRGGLRLPPGATQEAPSSRVHEVRLRQQLQVLINVRPIVTRRAPGAEPGVDVGTPRTADVRQMARRHTFGEK